MIVDEHVMQYDAHRKKSAQTIDCVKSRRRDLSIDRFFVEAAKQ